MIVHIEQFAAEIGLEPTWRDDAALAVYLALKRCGEIGRATLVFPQGVYHFRPDHACERQVYITNHDQKILLRTAFPMTRMKHVTIDGQGSTFLFHGGIIPFLLDDCHDVTMCNVTIDWERPMFEQGEFVAAGSDYFDVRLLHDDYQVADGRLHFSYDGRSEPVWGLHEIDPATGAHAYGSGDRLSWSRYKTFAVAEVEPGVIRFSGRLQHVPKPGNATVMRIGRREHPGIFVKGGSDIRIESVTIHHAPGMGFVAQNCTNIRLSSFHVQLKPGSGRWVTATADATHFTSCRGKIELDGCLFENQLDDPANVHGIYAIVTARVADDKLLVRLMHDMQIGVELGAPGDEFRFVDIRTLLPKEERAAVASVDVLNARDVLLTFERPLPAGVQPGDAVENVSCSPDFIVRRCTVRANRARGFLITTAGNVLLEHNVISAPGAGIKISGDAGSWYESGAVEDVLIRRNTFLDCNYCYPNWGKAVIDIDPEIAQPEALPGYYHRNIRIEDNEFDTFDSRIVSGHSVDGFTFRGNVIRASGTYVPHGGGQPIELGASRNVIVEDNRFEPAGAANEKGGAKSV